VRCSLSSTAKLCCFPEQPQRCYTHGPKRTRLLCKFSLRNAQQVPFVLYADTETSTNTGAHKLFSFHIHAKHESDPSLDVHYALRAQKESQVGDYMVRQFARYLTAANLPPREHKPLSRHGPEEYQNLSKTTRRNAAFLQPSPSDKGGWRTQNSSWYTTITIAQARTSLGTSAEAVIAEKAR
jgi:hypothetical protein